MSNRMLGVSVETVNHCARLSALHCAGFSSTTDTLRREQGFEGLWSHVCIHQLRRPVRCILFHRIACVIQCVHALLWLN